MTVKNLFKRLFKIQPALPARPIVPGLYHYMREHDGQYTRFHLRVEPGGNGMLIANATVAAQLSASGVVIAKEWLDGKNEAEIAADLQAHFRGTTAPQIQADLKQVQDLIRKLAAPGDEYPIFNLEDAAVSPFETELIAPLEADIPLADPELVVPVLDRVWQVGIPHVTILVPENPDTAHLVRAVERAEDLGMICGISGRASDLGQDSLLEDVAKAGVDHVTVFFASAEPDIHDSLFGAGDHRSAQQIFERTQKLEVADVGHVPLVASTAERLDETLALLQQLKVSNVIFFAIATEADENSEGAIPAKAMRQVAAQVEEDAHQGQLRYLWEVPVKRNPELSLSAQVRQGPRCSGDIAVRIEPDGSVIPPRGPRLIAGNILQDSWDSIWNHPVFQRYRERVEAPTRCEICPGLTICAADCPVKPEGWS